MKHAILVAAALLISAVNAQASAQINIKDFDGKKSIIALDSEATPRSSLSENTVPSIKFFREGGEHDSYCIEGSDRGIRRLLGALVNAADGDGDSYATLKAIYKNLRSWAVLVEISDESGIKVERFAFPNCR